jgi:hypothetical protein
MELNFFRQTKATIDATHYLESVHNRFEALLKFTVTDASERFKELITALERRPAHTKCLASYFGGHAVNDSVITSAADRSYLGPHAEGARTAEVLFWKRMLESDAVVPKSGSFSETWRPPQTITVSKSKMFQPTRTITETALVEAYSKQESITSLVNLALKLNPTTTTDPDVAAALEAICKTDEYQSAIDAKEAAAAEARAAAVESKKRKLAANSAAIANQPRRGAVNEVPTQKKGKSGTTQASIASFFS